MPRREPPWELRPGAGAAGFGIAGVLLAGLAMAAAAGADSGGAAIGTESSPESSPRRGRIEEILARTGAYVERFQSEMEAAVFDEEYVQLLRQPCCREPRKPASDPLLEWRTAPDGAPPKGILARRQLKAEVLLVQVAGGMRVGYRDVFEVDGRTLPDRSERVRRLFLAGTQESTQALGRIASESARFNLGSMQRTTNLPTLPLLYLVPAMHSRLYVSSGGDEEIDGVKVVVLEFREDASPTLAASAHGIDMPARGRAWVEPENGRIRRIELRYAPGARRVMTVWFREDPRIDVLPPAKMWEWYEKLPVGDDLPIDAAKRAWPADLEAVATYSNLRIFSVDTSEEIGAPSP